MSEPVAALEPHYTISVVAKAWGISEKTVYRKFRDMPGVLQVPVRVLLTKRRRRPKVMLRIPESLLLRTYQDWSGGFGGKVELRRG